MTNAVAVLYVGLASWFVPHKAVVHGHWTCASRTLPRGTVVLVTERHNGLSVVCEVADFGAGHKPTREGVIIDLAKDAFAKLDGLELGRADVTVEILTKGAK